jgi:hypothetical protein
MEHSESLGALATALADAQSEIENAAKNAKNPHFKSTYADLAELINTTRPVLTRHGLSVVQCPRYADGVVHLETMLLHKSGEWIKGEAGAPVAKMDAQGVGSATTYLRRYSLAAVCNIAQEDDDGNGAIQGGRQQGQPQRAKVNGGAITGQPWDTVMPFGDTKGTRLMDHTDAQLRKTAKWCEEKDPDGFADLIAACRATIDHRALDGKP